MFKSFQDPIRIKEACENVNFFEAEETSLEDLGKHHRPLDT